MLHGIQARLAASAATILVATSIAAPPSIVARTDAAPTSPSGAALLAPTTANGSARDETSIRQHLDVATAEREAKAHPRAAHRPSPMRPLPHRTRSTPPTSPATRSSGIVRLDSRPIAARSAPISRKPSGTTTAAAASYTAFFLDGGDAAPYFADEVDTYTTADATFTPTVSSGTGVTVGNLVFLEADGPNGAYSVEFVGPDGAELTTGTYSNAVFPPNAGAGQPGMFITAQGSTCSDAVGTFTITEISHTGTTLDSLAASFSWTCTGFTGSILGEVRYQASTDLSHAMRVHPSPDDLGNVPVGSTTPTVVTIENRGTTALHLGAFSLTSSADFSIGTNPCATATVAPSGSCAVTVNVNPSATGATSTKMSWTDDSTRTSHTVPISATAIDELDVTLVGGIAGSAVDVYPPSWTTPAQSCSSATCSFDVSAYAGQSLRLVARPPVAGAFVGWSGACAGRDPCLLDVTTSRAVTAQFGPIVSGTTDLRVVDGQAGYRDAEFGCPVAPCIEPPDAVVAVNASQIVSATNATMRVRDRAGALLADLPLWAFFIEPSTTVIGGDPQIVWDPSHGRWIASEFSGDCQQGYLHVAVSDSANAAAGWLVYRFSRSSAFVDFPGLGISADKVVVSGNVFDISSVTCDAANFQAPVVYEMSLGTLLAGGSLTAAVVTMPASTSTPRPAVVMDGTAALPVVVDTGDTGFGPTGIGYFVITGSGPLASTRFGPVYDMSVASNLPPYQFGTPLSAPADPPRPAGFVPSGDPVIDGRPIGVWVQGGDLWFSSSIACTPPTDGSARACARVTRVHLRPGWNATALESGTPIADLWVTTDSASGPLRFEARWRITPESQMRAEIHYGTLASPGPVMFQLCPPPGSLDFCPPFDNWGGTRSSADLITSPTVPNMTAAITAISQGKAYLEMYSDFGGPPVNDTRVALSASSVADRSVFDDVIGIANTDTFFPAVGWATDGTIYLSATQSGGGGPIRTVATSAPAGTNDGTFAPLAVMSRGQTAYGGTRWGDYQTIARDPADSHGVWASHEYVTTNTSWQAWVSHLSSGSSGAPNGSFTIDGGATHTLDPMAVLDIQSSAGTRTTEARVSNGASMAGPILSAGRFVPLGHPTSWSLIDAAVGGSATTGAKTVYVQFGDGRGAWSAPAAHSITLDPQPAVTRFSGGDRYATAAAISAGSFSPGAPVVFIATGAGFPDALAGAAVAGRIGAPVLLVTATTIPPATKTELGRLKADRIVILGGTGVVSNAVGAALAAYAPGGVFRIAGSNRYATAAAIAFNYFVPGVDTAFIATGGNFPDALAGAAVAGKVGGPILLVTSTTIPTATDQALGYLHPKHIVILGGTGAVSSGVASALKAYTTGTVTRIAGANRYATAAAISKAYFAPGVPAVFVATGTNFPDALAGAAVAGHLGVPVILVTPTAIPPAADLELQRLNPGRVVILGGTGAVSAAVALQLGTYIGP